VRCTRCKDVWYCGEICQARHWRGGVGGVGGHREECVVRAAQPRSTLRDGTTVVERLSLHLSLWEESWGLDIVRGLGVLGGTGGILLVRLSLQELNRLSTSLQDSGGNLEGPPDLEITRLMEGDDRYTLTLERAFAARQSASDVVAWLYIPTHAMLKPQACGALVRISLPELHTSGAGKLNRTLSALRLVPGEELGAFVAGKSRLAFRRSAPNPISIPLREPGDIVAAATTTPTVLP
jgi:hypothetical protein